MTLGHPLGAEERYELSPGVWTITGRLSELFPVGHTTHWQGWVGSQEWDNLDKPRRHIVVRRPSENINSIDGENQALQMRLFEVRRSLLLTGPVDLVWGKNWYFGGVAKDQEPNGELTSLQTLVRLSRVIRPYCSTRDSFLAARPPAGDWMRRWATALAELDRVSEAGLPPLLFFGVLAFERALDAPEVEFKVPDCVRAIEAVVGLPQRGGGRDVFADRILSLMPELRADPYVGGEGLRERLVRLYVHRIECVHGKVPFGQIAAAGLNAAEEIARFDHLAETAARGVLRRALGHPAARAVFATREALELAWQDGAFP